MIFNYITEEAKFITEQEILDCISEESDDGAIVINSIIIDEKLVLETVNSGEVNMPVKRNNSRVIMIGNQTDQHGPRMKVSAYAGKISKRSSDEDDGKGYISIFMRKEHGKDGLPVLDHKGNIKDIDMKQSELKLYYDFFVDNYNLIRLARDNDNSTLCDKALVKDAKLRKDGVKIERGRNGDLYVYDKNGNIDYKENLKGEEIS
jgi:hypothetical protein